MLTSNRTTLRIEISELGKAFGSRILFDAVTTTLEPGLTAILGPSGSGKTTFLLIIAGIEAPSAGRVTWPQPRAAHPGGFSWIMQSANLLTTRSALANIALPLVAHGARRRDAEQQAMLALDAVGLAGLAARQAGSLSGGERQRVAVARALTSPARLVLADEPTASLGTDHRDLVVQALQAVAASDRIVLVATHDPAVASACDRVVHLGRTDGTG